MKLPVAAPIDDEKLVELIDNRCLLHKANGDYDMDQTRYLYRVMLQGDVPR